jgi:hypothetical protein
LLSLRDQIAAAGQLRSGLTRQRLKRGGFKGIVGPPGPSTGSPRPATTQALYLDRRSDAIIEKVICIGVNPPDFLVLLLSCGIDPQEQHQLASDGNAGMAGLSKAAHQKACSHRGAESHS